jgi:hypothetical protein
VYLIACSPNFKGVRPTTLACAVVVCLRARRGLVPAWPAALAAMTGMKDLQSHPELAGCIANIQALRDEQQQRERRAAATASATAAAAAAAGTAQQAQLLQQQQPAGGGGSPLVAAAGSRLPAQQQRQPSPPQQQPSPPKQQPSPPQQQQQASQQQQPPQQPAASIRDGGGAPGASQSAAPALPDQGSAAPTPPLPAGEAVAADGQAEAALQLQQQLEGMRLAGDAAAAGATGSSGGSGGGETADSASALQTVGADAAGLPTLLSVSAPPALPTTLEGAAGGAWPPAADGAAGAPSSDEERR